ncbi:MAG: hypothetical protein AB7E95_06195 [Kiritimatiellales bacterium]|jgi:hypothetical protein
MSDTPNQKNEPQSPFSPLQSGCAVVMLTNMLIYLGVVAFVFNLLDPSKIDENYLAKRGFTTSRQIRESDEDREFRQISEARREEHLNIQAGTAGEARPEVLQEDSPAVKMSRLQKTRLASSKPDEPAPPKAAITPSTYGGETRPAKSRLYSVYLFPRASVRQAYSPYSLPLPQILEPETYPGFSFQIPPSIDFPTFAIPSANPAQAYIYKPSSPLPEITGGGPRLTAPAVGAESTQTNRPAAKAQKDQP